MATTHLGGHVPELQTDPRRGPRRARGRRTFSRISRARLHSGSASLYLPLLPYSTARLFSVAATYNTGHRRVRRRAHGCARRPRSRVKDRGLLGGESAVRRDLDRTNGKHRGTLEGNVDIDET